jgi:hypothetical protein
MLSEPDRVARMLRATTQTRISVSTLRDSVLVSWAVDADVSFVRSVFGVGVRRLRSQFVDELKRPAMMPSPLAAVRQLMFPC